MQWNAEEAAPRDGSKILVCGGPFEGVDMVSWSGGKKRGAWRTEDGVVTVGPGIFKYWMPLPEPVKKED